MKNSKEYSQKIRKLYHSFKRKYPKVKKVIYDEVVEALVYGIISENMSEPAAQSAVKRFNNYFIDFNDLRVSRPEEIVEMLSEDTPVTRGMASALTTVLRAVFSQYNTVSLEALKKIGKRPARQVLEKMDGTTPFVIDYCMLTSLQGHAIPLTKKMVEYLKSNELVHPQAGEQEIEGFLARQISAEKAYEFYAFLRRQSESRKAKKKTSTRAVRKAKTKKAKRKEAR